MEIKKEDMDKILSSHLQKEEKVAVYKPRVEANIINGFVNFKATWSWWAFFATWAFFLYRKMYLQAGIFFILNLLLVKTGFGSIVISIISGVTAFYFYTKKLENDLKIAGYNQKDLNEVLENLKQLGGFHNWVIWLAIVLNILLFGFIFLVIYGIAIAEIVPY